MLQHNISRSLRSLESDTLAAITGCSNPAMVDRSNSAIWRLSVLVRVADIPTQRLSLDHQLPRLIELIPEALGAERATLFLQDPDSGELFSL